MQRLRGANNFARCERVGLDGYACARSRGGSRAQFEGGRVLCGRRGFSGRNGPLPSGRRTVPREQALANIRWPHFRTLRREFSAAITVHFYRRRSHGSWARSMHVAVVGPEVETHRHPVTAAGCRCGKLQNRHRRGFASAKLGSRLRSLGKSSGTSCAARREIVEAMRSQPDVHACSLTERRACAAAGRGRRCTAAVVVGGAGAGVCVRPGHRCAGARPRRCRC